MNKIPKIVHFEINADDPIRAKGFYENVFNWKIEKWKGSMEYWVIDAGEENEEGINGGLQKREESEDQIFNYIKVPSVDKVRKKIEDNGGTVISPKITVPGVGYFYMFKDTEGNKLGIMEEDESAK
ncbi:MAG: VOC family protein [Promethearchaeota archaeon]